MTTSGKEALEDLSISRRGMVPPRIMSMVFILVGVALILSTRWVPGTVIYGVDVPATVLTELGVALLAYPVIQLVLTGLGGDPISSTYLEIERLVTKALRVEKLGIQSVYKSRSDVRAEDWLARIERASEIDMLGNVLRHWVENPKFRELVQNRARGRKKAKFRLMIYDPEQGPILQRSREEGDDRGILRGHAQESLDRIQELISQLPARARSNTELRLVATSGIYCSIVRIDDAMLVTPYLSHKHGTISPALEINGAHTPLFEVYKDEFERLWRHHSHPP